MWVTELCDHDLKDTFLYLLLQEVWLLGFLDYSDRLVKVPRIYRRVRGGEKFGTQEGQEKSQGAMGRNFPGGPVAWLIAPRTGGPGSIPGQGTRSHRPQPRLGTAR